MNDDALEAARRIAESLGVRTVCPAERWGGNDTRGTERRILHERIMDLVNAGWNNKEIAKEVGVSRQAVGRHRRGEVT